MGFVSAKVVRVCPPSSVSVPVGLVLEMTVQAAGAVRVSWKRAFRSGWSKQGKAISASIGTNRV